MSFVRDLIRTMLLSPAPLVPVKYIFHIGDHRTHPGLFPTMGFTLHDMLVRRLKICERTGHTPVHFRLITFQGKDIVCPALDYHLGNLPLATHRVNGDDATFQLQDTQQFRYFGYLVALSCNLFLAQQ